MLLTIIGLITMGDMAAGQWVIVIPETIHRVPIKFFAVPSANKRAIALFLNTVSCSQPEIELFYNCQRKYEQKISVLKLNRKILKDIYQVGDIFFAR